MTNENEFVYEGIMPMYTRWAQMSEIFWIAFRS